MPNIIGSILGTNIKMYNSVTIVTICDSVSIAVTRVVTSVSTVLVTTVLVAAVFVSTVGAAIVVTFIVVTTVVIASIAVSAKIGTYIAWASIGAWIDVSSKIGTYITGFVVAVLSLWS